MKTMQISTVPGAGVLLSNTENSMTYHLTEIEWLLVKPAVHAHLRVAPAAGVTLRLSEAAFHSLFTLMLMIKDLGSSEEIVAVADGWAKISPQEHFNNSTWYQADVLFPAGGRLLRVATGCPCQRDREFCFRAPESLLEKIQAVPIPLLTGCRMLGGVSGSHAIAPAESMQELLIGTFEMDADDRFRELLFSASAKLSPLLQPHKNIPGLATRIAPVMRGVFSALIDDPDWALSWEEITGHERLRWVGLARAKR